MRTINFNFSFDMITIILLVLLVVRIVFVLADYKLFKRFIKKEKDRNLSFTKSQAEHYQETNITDDFIEEFIQDEIDKAINPTEEKVEE